MRAHKIPPKAHFGGIFLQDIINFCDLPYIAYDRKEKSPKKFFKLFKIFSGERWSPLLPNNTI